MKENIIVDVYGNRKIAIKGIGKMYYQDGFPIPMAVEQLKEHGVEVSMLHVADELLKNGFPKKRVIAIICDDMIEGDDRVDIALIEGFCDSDYEGQRKMIFEYLFSSVDEAKDWTKGKLTKLYEESV